MPYAERPQRGLFGGFGAKGAERNAERAKLAEQFQRQVVDAQLKAMGFEFEVGLQKRGNPRNNIGRPPTI